MLFNSYEFILLFLPITLIVYFFLNKQKLLVASKAWLVLSSLFFYSWWNIKYLPLILISIIFNFSIGTSLSNIDNVKLNKRKISKKTILIFGIVFNLLLLAYFKYTDFFISNINHLIENQITLLKIVLPLGISFFTFTQIAYLVDAYKGEIKEMDYLNYSLFVTFFPHLLAGPILHHKEMMPQFDNLRKKFFNHRNLSIGLFLFFIGLFKKLILADTFALWANFGFDKATYLSFFEAWFVSLSYSFQLYFDFSGYTDMALGTALMFNIILPVNFNSPYKAIDIQDFWRRWHITLSRFLRDYIYIPLGGNKLGEFQTYQNLFLTFLIGGLWHGAGWNFIFWGALHGFALVINRLWKKINFKLHSIVAWLITFNFVNITWIFFRAKTWDDALKLLKGLFGFNDILIPRISHASISFKGLNSAFEWNIDIVFMLVISFIIILVLKNSNELIKNFKPNYIYLIVISFLAFISILQLGGNSEFLYFRF